MQRLPGQILLPNQDGHGAIAYSAAQVVAGDPSALLQQKGLFGASTHADAWPWLIPNGLVHGASHPRGYETIARARANGRKRQHEADETFIGRVGGVPKQKAGWAHKNVVLTLVERGGVARSSHVCSPSIAEIIQVVKANVAKETAMMTDASSEFRNFVGFTSHDTVNHSREEYARYEGGKLISTNAIEGYFSIFNRGMRGVYQHCSEGHLHRYLAEFDSRYSNRIALGVDDAERASRTLKGAEGKR